MTVGEPRSTSLDLDFNQISAFSALICHVNRVPVRLLRHQLQAAGIVLERLPVVLVWCERRGYR